MRAHRTLGAAFLLLSSALSASELPPSFHLLGNRLPRSAPGSGRRPRRRHPARSGCLPVWLL